MVDYIPPQLPVDRILGYIERGQYRDALNLLRDAQQASFAAHDVNYTERVAVLMRLCQMGTFCREEIDFYCEALEDANKRERRVRDYLEPMVRAFNQKLGEQASGALPGTRHKTTTHLLPVVDPHHLRVYTLGTFQLYRKGEAVHEKQSRRGLAIFKYLLFQQDHRAHKEQLMDLFWRDANPEAARNNLNVAIYGLRKVLRNGTNESYILYENDFYSINPELNVWVDTVDFEAHVEAGRRLIERGLYKDGIDKYIQAEILYRGELFPDDRWEDYDEWIYPYRTQLHDHYIHVVDALSSHYLEKHDYRACIAVCNKALAFDLCVEQFHRALMICFSRQGHKHLAKRQYQQLRDALEEELGVEPDDETNNLYNHICANKDV